jgi:hypothetical protein
LEFELFIGAALIISIAELLLLYRKWMGNLERRDQQFSV